MSIAYWLIVASFISSLTIGWYMIPRILVISRKHQLFDIPNKRKIHDTPIPRLGGLTFFPTITITISLLMGIRYIFGWDIINVNPRVVLVEFLMLLAGSCILYLVGVKDDIIGVSYRWKFLVQIVCGGLLALSGLWMRNLGGFFGVDSIPVWLGYLATIFVVVFITNAFNLIDGIDGLASGLTAIALFVFGVIFIIERQLVYALIAFSTFGVIMPFWFYNVFGNRQKGHKLFMGDTGSLTLGYIMSFLLLRIMLTSFEQKGEPGFILIAISALLVPLFDVIRVFFHRIRKHRNPFMPDRNHIHHKLIRSGMKMRYVLLTIVGISLFYIILNYLLNKFLDITLIIVIDFILWIMLQYFLNKKITQVEGTPHSI